MKEIEDLIRKAERFLKTAKLSLEDGDYDSCVSRSYYAMFFVTEAILLTGDIEVYSHKGALVMFEKHFVKTGKIDRQYGKDLRRAKDLRQKADYAFSFKVNQNEAEDILESADEFFERNDRLPCRQN